MRAVTVRQPWAWAIVHGDKYVENRTRNIAGSYRGPLAIHAGLAAFDKHNAASVAHRLAHGSAVPTNLVFGAFIGVVDLLGVHRCGSVTDYTDEVTGCCEPWGDHEYEDDPPHGGLIHHLELRRPRALRRPIAAKGMLGLWTPTADQVAMIEGQIGGDLR